MISKSIQDRLRANRHLIAALRSGHKSTGDCLYSYSDGSMCVASACFPDPLRGLLSKDIETNGKGIDYLRDTFMLSGDLLDCFNDLENLQFLHDNCLESQFEVEVGHPDADAQNARQRRTLFILELCRMLDTRLEADCETPPVTSSPVKPRELSLTT